MARKPKTEAADAAPMLALVDQDAPAGTALVVVEPDTPPDVQARRAAAIVLLQPERFDQFYERMHATTSAHVPDVTTATGRDAIRSLAFRVTKTKTTLEKAALELTADWRARTKAVNDARAPIVQRLDTLADEVRKPLTDWEAAEAARVAANRAVIDDIRVSASVLQDDTSDTVAERGRRIWALEFAEPQWLEDEAVEATNAKAATVAALVAAQKRLKVEEADRAELAQLRADREAREAREAEERAERERVAAAEQVERERAEAEAEAERQRIARQEQAERDRLAAEAAERERIAEAERAAEQRARDAAERERREAEERAAAEQRERDAEIQRQRDAERAEHERQLAAERAERERLEAAAREREAEAQRQRDAEEAERRRIAAERTEAERVERERQANAEHRRTVLAEVAEDIVSAIPGLSDDMARDIANAIGSGQVRHCTVAF